MIEPTLIHTAYGGPLHLGDLYDHSSPRIGDTTTCDADGEIHIYEFCGWAWFYVGAAERRKCANGKRGKE